MDEVSRAYFEMYGYTVTNEMFSHNGEVKYQIMKEEVDTEAVKERISKGGKEAANPKHSRKDVEALHNKRREEVKELAKEEYRSDISYARASVSGSRKRAKEQPGIHKGDDTKYQHDLNKKAFKNLVNQERAKRTLNKEEFKAKNKGSVRSTVLPKSRERDIGRHDDWKDPHPDTQDFGQDSPAKQKLKRRMIAVIGTRRREDKEAGLRKEDSEFILSYLLDNGYASDEHSAKNIMEAMSEQWIHFILDEEVH